MKQQRTLEKDKESKLEKSIRLDKQAEKKGQAVSIAIGVIGMGSMGLACPIYKKLTEK